MLRRESLTILEERVMEGYLIKYKKSGIGPFTYYSCDYRRYKNSMICIYDKAAKQIKDNQISHKTIKSNPFPIRLEFRLSAPACDWLNYHNIRGKELDIVKRYTETYLPIQYKKLLLGNINLNDTGNKDLDMLIENAQNISQERYMGKELQKTEKISVALKRKPDKDAKNILLESIKNDFLAETENIEKSKKYINFSKKAVEK
jgi:hypothetical protein